MSRLGVPDYSQDKGAIDVSLIPSSCIVFTNCRLCVAGRLTAAPSSIVIAKDTGLIDEILEGVSVGSTTETEAQIINLQNAIVAPGLLELQSNGMRGFHFTHFNDPKEYGAKIDDIARYLPTVGVTGFWATIPTVASAEFKRVCSYLCCVMHANP